MQVKILKSYQPMRGTMRDKASNKLMMSTNGTEETQERDPRFPDTAPENLGQRYRALVRRRVKNKLRRESKQKQRT
jgi:hypothetical protein